MTDGSIQPLPGIVERLEDTSSPGVIAALRVAIEQNRRIVEGNDNCSVIDHKWVKETPVPKRLIQYIDRGVIEKLPHGTQIQGISPSGKSNWARTAKVEATNEAGEITPFFIKVQQFEHGKNMASSEYLSMKALYGIMPEIVAEPIAWGSYVEDPDTYFFLCRFCEMSGEIPDLHGFPKLIAEMHKRGVSPTGQFGMPLVTYSGRNPLYFPPSDSWEECFSRGLEMIFDMEEETHGPDEELQELREGVMTTVIPRLLRPLQSQGRTLAPCLVHGDLWDGNASVDVSTGSPRIFDGVCFYAHNEYELAPWWAPRHEMTDEYIAEYVKHFPVSEPAEDFKYRGLLYRLRFDLHCSSLYPGTLRRRGLAKDTMRELLEKFPEEHAG